jgi:predicted transcriptional regulator
MKALWQLGSGTVADITSALAGGGRALAPTTVATLLQRLDKQGWLAHDRDGRPFVYRPVVTEREAAQGVLRQVMQSFFGGRVSAMTSQLFELVELGPEELKAMRELLREKGG